MSPRYGLRRQGGKEAILERFRQVGFRRHDYSQEWKALHGRPVVGYLCTYVPEEIIYAAGLLPVRILGSHEPEDLSEPHIYSMLCSYCRDCLAQGLRGRYGYLDGIVVAHGCSHIQHTFDSWQRHIPIAYSHRVFVPQCVHQVGAQEALLTELRVFKSSLEDWLGKPVSTEALEKAVAVYNLHRHLMTQLYERRQGDSPPISGAEAMEIVVASQLIDKEEHNQWLAELLAELTPESHDQDPGIRLILIGQTENIGLVRLMESLGTTVVIDDLCSGWRYFRGEIPPGDDPLRAIAQRYVERPPCPMKDLKSPRLRLPYIQKLAQEYRVDGAVHIRQKFCDPHGYEVPALGKLFQDMGIPFLALEEDITVPLGQLQTRLEAHLEVIRMEVVG